MSGARPDWTTRPGASRGDAERPRVRRWLLDAVGVLTLLVLIGGAVLYFRTHQEREAMIERAAGELRRVELELKYRAAAKLPGLNGKGWPQSVEEEWFHGPSGVPRNPLVSRDRPWVDVASGEELDLDHPSLKMAADPRLAGFWYNPNLGVVRARVPVMVSDEDSLELYNRVNGTHLASIFGAGLAPRDDSASASESASSESSPAFEITSTGQVRRRTKE